jgi:MinD superfamily P-loop ATPase
MRGFREIVVISGKGGTGKTSVCAAFAALARRAVLCDLDVDVPDLHIVLAPTPRETHDFLGGNKAVIGQQACVQCGRCRELCRFGAVLERDGRFEVDRLACEGCGVCQALCPQQAIAFPEALCGTWSVSATRFGTLVHAQLVPGQENSGKLVQVLKTRAREEAEKEGAGILLCDGSPGIGCPVIASLSGASLACAVAEPTLSGLHDFQRAASVCRQFRIPVAVVVNRADLNPGAAGEFREICRRDGHAFLGEIPFDPAVPQAAVQGLAVTERDGPCARRIREIWERLLALDPNALRGQRQGPLLAPLS